MKVLSGHMGPPRRVALSLGAGGARGYAHIGALQVLKERDLEVVGIAGASMGALVGGLHAAGRLADYTDWVLTLTQLQVVRLLDVSRSGSGAFRAEKVFTRMRDLIDGVAIEDLPIPFTAVATDLFARRPVWFQRGPLDVAIRASIAMPGVFTPVVEGGRVLVDGGVMDPVPVAPIASIPADLHIAVSLGGEREPLGREDPLVEHGAAGTLSERIRRGASSLFDHDLVRSVTARLGTAPDPGSTGEESVVSPYGEAPQELHGFEVMTLSLEAMQAVVARYQLAGNPPDVLVTVSKDACRTMDFHRAAEMIELGRTLTAEALDRAGVSAT